ncbi:DUF5908 family protein [Pseudotenacibaculum haliotis]|uniref:DUF5908 family protein n=1 Tax=Pseudotenacibaculum haliotis TaxID=1862138 RepID=A0ABW5LV49_9FLAO
MPIEIKEMHIKIHLDEGANKGNSTQDNQESLKGTEAIINTCVEAVMEILEKQKER